MGLQRLDLQLCHVVLERVRHLRARGVMRRALLSFHVFDKLPEGMHKHGSQRESLLPGALAEVPG